MSGWSVPEHLSRAYASLSIFFKTWNLLYRDNYNWICCHDLTNIYLNVDLSEQCLNVCESLIFMNIIIYLYTSYSAKHDTNSSQF